MIQDKEDIKINEIIEICADFINNPEDADKMAAFEELKQALVIRTYMPLQDKEILLRKALIDVRTVDDEAYHFTTALEIAKLFDILLAYVVNLDQNINTLWKDYQFYDILWLAGIPDYILSFAGPDFYVCEKMMDATLSFDNLKKLMGEIKFTSPEEVQKLTKAFEDFTVNTDLSIIKEYSNIVALNDPLLVSIKDNLEQGLYQGASKLDEAHELEK